MKKSKTSFLIVTICVTLSSTQTVVAQGDLVDSWFCQTHPDSLAFTNVMRAKDPLSPGNHVLGILCNFDSKKREESKGGLGKGEVLRDLRTEGGAPVKGLRAPVNFRNCKLQCRVLVPTGGMGPAYGRSGIQLVLKDATWKSYYSKWLNIPGEGTWFTVTATPPHGDFVEPGFDVAKSVMVGMKMGLNEATFSDFKGSVFLDDFKIMGPDGKVVASWDFEPGETDAK